MSGVNALLQFTGWSADALQNYVINTGSEVILVDTGMPKEYPEQVPDEKTPIFMGNKVTDYVSALALAGYKNRQHVSVHMLPVNKNNSHSEFDLVSFECNNTGLIIAVPGCAWTAHDRISRIF